MYSRGEWIMLSNHIRGKGIKRFYFVLPTVVHPTQRTILGVICAYIVFPVKNKVPTLVKYCTAEA